MQTIDGAFPDVTDWSVTAPNGAADYRFNGRAIIRVCADNYAHTSEFLVEGMAG